VLSQSPDRIRMFSVASNGSLTSLGSPTPSLASAVPRRPAANRTPSLSVRAASCWRSRTRVMTRSPCSRSTRRRAN
jgi:hypothetical protein